MNARTALLVPVALFASAGPASAAEGAGDGTGLAWMTLFPTCILLMALPLAILTRATLRLPLRIAGILEVNRFPAVLIGAGNLLLLVLLGWGAKRVPALGPVTAAVMLVLGAAALLGLTGVATNLARRLYRDEDRGGSVGAFTLAWLVVSGITLLPVAGLIVHLWLAAQGIGGVVLSMKRQPEATTE